MRLKVRDSRKTLMEILIPLYTLGTLIVLKVLIPNPNFPAIVEPRGDGKIFEHFNQLKNHTIAVVPHSNTSRHQTTQVRNLSKLLELSINLLFILVSRRSQHDVAINATRAWDVETKLADVRNSGRPFIGLLARSVLNATRPRLSH